MASMDDISRMEAAVIAVKEELSRLDKFVKWVEQTRQIDRRIDGLPLSNLPVHAVEAVKDELNNAVSAVKARGAAFQNQEEALQRQLGNI